jgi:hypothetical protein
MGLAANWVSVVSTICCVFLLVSWTVLPVDKTFRHYLSISLTVAVMMMNVGFGASCILFRKNTNPSLSLVSSSRSPEIRTNASMTSRRIP